MPLASSAISGASFTFLQQTHEGPLPAPGTLREYDEVVPGLAAIIVDEFRAEAAHQRALGISEAKQARLGLKLGFAAVVSVLLVATVALLTGHAVTGGILAAVDIAALASAFIVGSTRGS